MDGEGAAAATGRRAVIALAAATIREHTRRRLIAVFAIGSVLVSIALVVIALNRQDTDIFGTRFDVAGFAALGVMRLSALIAALVLSMNNVGQPFSTGEAALVLARPVSRAQYAAGRFVGSTVTVVGFAALLAVETQIVSVIDSGSMSGQLWGHWVTQSFDLVVVCAVTTLFSAFVPHPALAAVGGYLVDEVLSLAAFGMALVQGGTIRGVLATAVKTVWFVTPKYLLSPLQIVQLRQLAAVAPKSAPRLLFHNTPALVAWGLAYLAAMLYASVLLTRRKEL